MFSSFACQIIRKFLIQTNEKEEERKRRGEKNIGA